jgi:DNA-binding Xre family transcriptional regulator
MEEIVLEVDDSFGVKYAGKYVFHGITWGKYSALLTKYSVTDKLTGQILSVDNENFNAEQILSSLRSQPEGNPVTFESLISHDSEKGIPALLGAKLLECASKVNLLSTQEINELTLSVLRKKPTIKVIEAFLCHELKCRPSELTEESAKKIHELIVFLDAQAKTIPEKSEKVGFT